MKRQLEEEEDGDFSDSKSPTRDVFIAFDMSDNENLWIAVLNVNKCIYLTRVRIAEWKWPKQPAERIRWRKRSWSQLTLPKCKPENQYAERAWIAMDVKTQRVFVGLPDLTEINDEDPGEPDEEYYDSCFCEIPFAAFECDTIKVMETRETLIE